MMRLSWFILVGLVLLAAIASAQPGDDGAEPIVEDIGALPCCETDNGQCLPPEWQCVRATLDSDLGICSSLYGYTVTEVNWSDVAPADRISKYFCGVDPSLWVESVLEELGYDDPVTQPETEPEVLPDLVVQSPSVSDLTPDSGAFFTLRAMVRNQGDGRSAVTTLRYYRSSNLTISATDTRVGTDVVGALSPGGTSSESVSLRAPATAGTYYYGACVDAVSGESDTVNNCSSGVRVAVSSVSNSGGGGTGGACTAGLVVNPGESCTYKGHTFTVNASGRGSIAFFSAGTGIDARGSTINGVLWNFHATKNSGSNSWTIHVAS